jgi:putative hemin transport protein
MRVTRNSACVHEKVGRYGNFRGGSGHAAMVFNREIDLRLFPAHWQHAFLVEQPVEGGMRRSVQVFDAAGDAVHKIFLRAGSDLEAWRAAKDALALDNQSPELKVAPRVPTEGPKLAPDQVETLRRRWAKMTDSHQFLALTKALQMNRLGAYRSVGRPWARPLAPEAFDLALQAAAAQGLQIMVFVGNRGCIQIHSGPVQQLRAMGPWQNVMDPGFNLHLRRDKIAEVWTATKPSRKGDVVSVEAFDAEGMLIAMMFGTGPEWDVNDRPRWDAMVAGLPVAEEALA